MLGYKDGLCERAGFSGRFRSIYSQKKFHITSYLICILNVFNFLAVFSFKKHLQNTDTFT